MLIKYKTEQKDIVIDLKKINSSHFLSINKSFNIDISLDDCIFVIDDSLFYYDLFNYNDYNSYYNKNEYWCNKVDKIILFIECLVGYKLNEFNSVYINTYIQYSFFHQKELSIIGLIDFLKEQTYVDENIIFKLKHYKNNKELSICMKFIYVMDLILCNHINNKHTYIIINLKCDEINNDAFLYLVRRARPLGGIILLSTDKLLPNNYLCYFSNIVLSKLDVYDLSLCIELFSLNDEEVSVLSTGSILISGNDKYKIKP